MIVEEVTAREAPGSRGHRKEKKKERNGDREWLVGRGWHWREFGYKEHHRRRGWHERRRQRIKVRTILSRSISLLDDPPTNKHGQHGKGSWTDSSVRILYLRFLSRSRFYPNTHRNYWNITISYMCEKKHLPHYILHHIIDVTRKQPPPSVLKN